MRRESVGVVPGTVLPETGSPRLRPEVGTQKYWW